MTALERYITKNPMRAETRRSFRRFFALGKVDGKFLPTGIGILAIIYLVIFGIIIANFSTNDPVTIIYLETGIFPLIGTIGFYSIISGERERRTWDVLRALPVTRGQIVVGKYLGASSIITAIWVILLPLIMGNALVYNDVQGHPPGHRVGIVLVTALIPWLTGLVAVAVTLFFSARCRTSLSALCVSLGIMFFWLVVAPSVLSALLNYDTDGDLRRILTMNPFLFVGQIHAPLAFASSEPHPIFGSLLTFVVFSLICIFGLVAWTERTLSFAEDQVEFIRRRKENA